MTEALDWIGTIEDLAGIVDSGSLAAALAEAAKTYEVEYLPEKGFFDLIVYNSAINSSAQYWKTFITDIFVFCNSVAVNYMQPTQYDRNNDDRVLYNDDANYDDTYDDNVH